MLDGAGDGARGRALGGGAGQGATQLPGDLALADDHGRQPGRGGEEFEMGGVPRPGAQGHGAAGTGALGEEGRDGVAQRFDRAPVGGVEHDRHAVAGAQNEDAVESRNGTAQVRLRMRSDGPEAGDGLQTLGAMVGGEKMKSHSRSQSSTRRRPKPNRARVTNTGYRDEASQLFSDIPSCHSARRYCRH